MKQTLDQTNRKALNGHTGRLNAPYMPLAALEPDRYGRRRYEVAQMPRKRGAPTFWGSLTGVVLFLILAAAVIGLSGCGPAVAIGEPDQPENTERLSMIYRGANYAIYRMCDGTTAIYTSGNGIAAVGDAPQCLYPTR